MVSQSTVAPRGPENANVELRFYKREGWDTVRYVSDTTVLEETLWHGRFITLFWSASGEVLREVGPGRGQQDLALDPVMHRVEAFQLEMDGQLLHNQWHWANAYERDSAKAGSIEAVVELHHKVRPVVVKVVTRLDGTPVLARWLEVTNAGATPSPLSRVSSCAGLLWNSPNWLGILPDYKPAFRIAYEHAHEWGMEGEFVWSSLPSEGLRVERMLDRNHSGPNFILNNEATGEFFFIALAWSSNWVAEFTPTPEGLLSFTLGPAGPAPLRVIDPGETISTPEVHIGPMHCDYDTAIHNWHRHMWASVIPPRPAGKEMFAIAGHVVEFPGEWILKEIDIAKEMGVQAFMVDAGWYGDVFGGWTERRGDWWEGEWLPGGLAGIREHAQRQGMLFGLWLEPEAAGSLSRIAQEHPDWLLQTDYDPDFSAPGFPSFSAMGAEKEENGAEKSGKEGRWPGNVRVLNLGKEEVARHFESEVLRIIGDHQLDFFKIDYNVRVYKGGENLRGGYLENEAWRHMEVLYATFDRVRREMPNVMLENCAGGGGRLDLGMMSRFHYSCESDFSSFPISIRAINALTHFAPPNALCYYHNHLSHAHLTADLETHLRVTLFVTTIFVGFGAQDASHTTPYFVKTKRYIRLAQEFCYPLIADNPLVYHHTPGIGALSPTPWCVLEYTARDHSRGFCGVFALNQNGAFEGSGEYVLRLRGVDRARHYTVRLDNSGESFTVSGYELANSGLVIRLSGRMLSELVLYSVTSSA